MTKNNIHSIRVSRILFNLILKTVSLFKSIGASRYVGSACRQKGCRQWRFFQNEIYSFLDTLILFYFCFDNQKNIFSGDLSGTLSKTATLVAGSDSVFIINEVDSFRMRSAGTPRSMRYCAHAVPSCTQNPSAVMIGGLCGVPVSDRRGFKTSSFSFLADTSARSPRNCWFSWCKMIFNG